MLLGIIFLHLSGGTIKFKRHVLRESKSIFITDITDECTVEADGVFYSISTAFNKHFKPGSPCRLDADTYESY